MYIVSNGRQYLAMSIDLLSVDSTTLWGHDCSYVVGSLPSEPHLFARGIQTLDSA